MNLFFKAHGSRTLVFSFQYPHEIKGEKMYMFISLAIEKNFLCLALTQLLSAAWKIKPTVMQII